MMELLGNLDVDKDDPRWKTHRTFFMSFKADMELEFGDDARRDSNPLTGLLKNFGLGGMEGSLGGLG